MPKILKTQCPHCRKTMKLKSSKAFGKQARCPKCQKSFRVKKIPSPAKVEIEDDDYEDDDYSGDDYESDDYSEDDYGEDDYEDDYEEPRRRPRSSEKRSGGKRSGGNKSRKTKNNKTATWVMPTLLISGGVLGATVFAVGIWFVWGLVDNNPYRAYLPRDAITITISRPGNNWSQLISGGITSEEANSLLAKQQEMWGVTYKDIVSITAAIGSQRDRIRVVRSSSNFDANKILARTEHEQAEHNGKKYFLIGDWALYFPDNRTLIAGSEWSVKYAIDGGPKQQYLKQFDFVDASYENVMVSLASNFDPPSASLLDDSNPEFISVGRNTGTSSINTKMQAAFATKSAAISAYDKGVAEQKERLEKWENSGRARHKQFLQTESQKASRQNLKYTEEEIEDALKCRESQMNSTSISRSGLVVTITYTSYETKWSKRLTERIKTRRTTLNEDEFAKTFGRLIFGRAVQ